MSRPTLDTQKREFSHLTPDHLRRWLFSKARTYPHNTHNMSLDNRPKKKDRNQTAENTTTGYLKRHGGNKTIDTLHTCCPALTSIRFLRASIDATSMFLPLSTSPWSPSCSAAASRPSSAPLPLSVAPSPSALSGSPPSSALARS